MSLWGKLTKPFRSKPQDVAALQGRIAYLNRRIKAGYDAAQAGGDLALYWANADSFDADSANSKSVRHTLIKRSRYEAGNNGYADGITQTYATDLVGKGPTLRMQTNSTGFNQMVERTWFLWCQAIQFRRKLWTMAHAKHVDGEAIAVIRRNDRIAHPIKLDLVLYEAEQCQTPMLMPGETGKVDGIDFDQFGNPLYYHFLSQHPGSGFAFDYTSERVPAEFVLHWFKMRRPGQHRGVPECSSTLNLGAAFRRLREASLSTAEKVAAWTLFLESEAEPDEDDTEFTMPMSEYDISHGMMTQLPNKVKPHQLTAEQPGANYDSFHKTLLNEMARPKNMPLNKAGCNSADYNYASGRLDHQTYYGNLDVDREDGNDLVLDRLFNVWFNASVRTFGWLGGEPEAVTAAGRFHIWDWPKHLVADVEAEANANDTCLKSGQKSIVEIKTGQGVDPEDSAAAEATYWGITVEQLKKRQLDSIYPPAPATAATGLSDEAVDAALRSLNRRGLLAHTNGHNGAHHG